MTMHSIAVAMGYLVLVLVAGGVIAWVGDWLIGAYELWRRDEQRQRALTMKAQLEHDDRHRQRRRREGPIAQRFNERRE